MSFFVDFIFVISSCFYIIISLLKGKSLKGLKERIFFRYEDLGNSLQGKRPVCLHAVSVGEMISLSPLISLFAAQFPQEKIVVSTVTSAAYKTAKDIFSNKVNIIYLPLDISFIIRKAIALLNPKIFILTETEIWPNLILELSGRKIPMAVINGRISKKSFMGYKAAGFLFKPLLKKISLFCMKTQEDASRIITLGARKEKVEVTGSTKFDLALAYKVDEGKKARLLKIFNITTGENVIVFGSTHDPEEKIIAEFILKTPQSDNLIIIIAPRHIERAQKIVELYNSLGINCQLFSSLSEEKTALQKVVIIDKMGVLRDIYALSSFAFVGGSLARCGGHNILEPAGFGKAVIFGKWIYNFKEEAELLLRNNGAVMVENKKEFEEILRQLLLDKPRVIKMGEAALKALDKNKGAAAADLEFLKDLI